MENLNAAIGLDFSLIGTKLHALYKKETKGYKILLIPSIQEECEGITVGDLINDIKKLSKGVTGTEADTSEIDNALSSVKQEESPLDKIKIVLNMAYLYIADDGEEKSEKIMEFAFNLNITTEGLIPKEIQGIVDVQHIGIAVWNTNRKQILDKMTIAKIEDYLELPAK
ncbi:MAG: hypothetical protein K2M46_11230 [Lachnospiraceae bacterium]|nr:hypothetical protein [Lachnospiraceae bacterium]